MPDNELDAPIDGALRGALRDAPLAPAPPGLYPAVMAAIQAETAQQAVRRQAGAHGARFHVAWLDLALGLFGALMFGMVFGLWGLFQTSQYAPRLEYLRLLALWNLQRAVYSEAAVVLWIGLGLAGLLAALLAAGMALSRRVQLELP